MARGDLEGAAEVLDALLEHHDGDELSAVDVSLGWTAAEPIGDAVADRDPGRARRLYALARASSVQEGTLATGPGEGLRSVRDVARVQAKIDALPGPGSPG